MNVPKVRFLAPRECIRGPSGDHFEQFWLTFWSQSRVDVHLSSSRCPHRQCPCVISSSPIILFIVVIIHVVISHSFSVSSARRLHSCVAWSLSMFCVMLSHGSVDLHSECCSVSVVVYVVCVSAGGWLVVLCAVCLCLVVL